MKIYHTETQGDYDALMVELERQGCKWAFGRKLTGVDNWYIKKHLTCIRVYDSKVYQAFLGYYKEEYPEVPIIKYKAKAEDKMKFTKENVYKLVDEYFWQADLEPCGDLIAEIHNLDDTPEKVVVPKFMAEFYEGCENATIYFLIVQLARYDGNSKLGKWYKNCEGRHDNGKANAQEVIAKMELYGYEVEKEPLYSVNINGQYLVKMIPERNVHKFVEEVNLRIWDPQAYQLTEADIKKNRRTLLVVCGACQ